MDTELKPCPFCGTKAMFVGGGSQRNGKLPIHVECASRLCLAKTKETLDRTTAAAIWNSRHESTKSKQPSPPLRKTMMY